MAVPPFLYEVEMAVCRRDGLQGICVAAGLDGEFAILGGIAAGLAEVRGMAAGLASRDILGSRKPGAGENGPDMLRAGEARCQLPWLGEASP